MGDHVAQHEVGMPAPPLRAFVARYTGYRYEGFAPGVHVGLPSRHLTFIVSLGAPMEVGWLDAPDDVEQMCSTVGGLQARPAVVHHDGTQFGVQVDVTPLGARALFGMPAAGIVEATVPIGDVLGRLGDELVERLHGPVTWPQRFAVLDAVLLRAVRAVPRPPAPEVVQAWRRMAGTAGAIGVRALADEVGWSRRHLSERFRGEFGLAPKIVGRVLRFERARHLVAAGQRSLGEVAVAVGYTDQAHMNRDWRQFVGASPTRWLADERFPFFQDGEVGRTADSSHG